MNNFQVDMLSALILGMFVIVIQRHQYKCSMSFCSLADQLHCVLCQGSTRKIQGMVGSLCVLTRYISLISLAHPFYNLG